MEEGWEAGATWKEEDFPHAWDDRAQNEVMLGSNACWGNKADV